MTKHQAQYVGLSFLQVVAAFLLVGVLLAPLVGGFVDHPCSVRYDYSKDCLRAQRRGVSLEEARNFRIEVFLSVFHAEWFGGGCHYQHSTRDALDLDNAVRTFRLEREGEELSVDGRKLKKNEVFEDHTWLTLGPLTTAQVEITNLGLVQVCDDAPSTKRLIVAGSTGTKFSALKGAPVVLGLVVLLVVVTRKVQKMRRENQRGQAA